MGAGKTTIGREVARLTDRPFIDTDEEIERRHGPISELFERGEAEFRRIEEATVADALLGEPSVIALGGGALGSAQSCARLRAHAFAVLVDAAVDEAWERVQGSDRPLARDRESFGRLYDERERTYREAADGVARDVEGVLLAALAIVLERGTLARLAEHVPGKRKRALIADERVLALHPAPLQGVVHRVPAGEEAKSLAVAERLYGELEIDRGGVVVALGGGATTDVAGFVAASYLRGVPWVAVPTTLVGQVDAAIGGKTGIDLRRGKNLVGAFHMPERVVIDPDVLSTLPERERRHGMAEVVKTGLLAGRPLWELPEDEMVRACAAFKAAVVLSDPYEQGRRSILNLGHTFAHALEAGAAYATVTHGQAVALGLLVALRLSGLETDAVERVLEPRRVRVDRERAWAALLRDKKRLGGRVRLVLLDRHGQPRIGADVPEAYVRHAMDVLIAM